MSMRYPGGLIATSPVNARYPSGVWTQAQAAPYQAQNVWTRDQYWPNTTLLLQGDGAVNGAQNNTFLDSSSNNFTITRNGNTTQGAFTPYEQDGYWSNYFAGSQSLSNGTNVTASGDFTLECWVNLSSYSAARIFFAVGNETANRRAFFIDSSGVIKIDLASVGATSLGGSVPINTWTHIAITRSSNTVTAYVNGVATGTTATISGTFGNGNGFYIGSVSDNSNSMVGYISNLRWVLGSVVYTAAFTPPVTPLTAVTNTSILSCQSNRFRDNSANAYALTVNGSPSVQSFQPFPGATTWSASVLGGSGYFDGSGDTLTAANNSAFNPGTGDFTIECWINTSATVAYQTIASVYGAPGSYNGWYFGLNSAGTKAVMSLFNGSSAQTDYTSTTTVNNGAWCHIAFVRTGTTVGLFINGTREATGTNSYNITATSGLQISGYPATSRDWNGYISNFRIIKGSGPYDATQSTLTVPTSPLTAITNTSLLLSMTNAGIYDNSMMNNLETVGNAQVSTSVVKYGTGSMYFDGSGDYLQTYNTKLLTFNGSSTFTVEGWFFQTAYVSTSGYMNNVLGDLTPTAATALYWSIGMNASNQPGVRWYDGAVKTADASTALTLNQWNHVAWVVTAGVVRIFINGVQATLTGTTTLTTPSTTVGYLIIGADRGYYMTGYIDDLRVSQGAARYITNFTPPPARMPGQ